MASFTNLVKFAHSSR